MKRTIPILFGVLLELFAVSCNKVNSSGPVLTQTRSHSGFTAISSSVAASVVYTQSPDYHVEIHAQQAILDRLSSEVTGSELRLSYSGNYSFGRHDPVTVYISGPDVTSFTLNGSGDMRCDSLRAGNKTVYLKTNGSGSMNFSSLTAGALTAETVGSGSIRTGGGRVQRLSGSVSGSGSIDFGDLHAGEASVQTSGSGSVHVTAYNTLDVRISGSGSVYYRGTPRITTSISGSGRLQVY